MIDFDNLEEQINLFFGDVLTEENALKKWESLTEEQQINWLKKFNLLSSRKIFRQFWACLNGTCKQEFLSRVSFPVKAMWKTSTFDIPVVVTGISGKYGDVVYFSIEGSSSSIPKDELNFEC